jgi:PPOX class probable F420-dependent enzyme
MDQRGSIQVRDSGVRCEKPPFKPQANLTSAEEQRLRIVMLMPAKLNAKAIKLIEGKNFAFLATIMPDGAPHVAPVWIDREGDTILVNTAMGRVKQKNVTREPRVSLSVADQSNMYDKIVIHGRVESQTIEGADAHIDNLAKKYIGKDKYPWRTAGEKRVILKIQPTHVLT